MAIIYCTEQRGLKSGSPWGGTASLKSFWMREFESHCKGQPILPSALSFIENNCPTPEWLFSTLPPQTFNNTIQEFNFILEKVYLAWYSTMMYTEGQLCYLFTQRKHLMASLWHIGVASITTLAPQGHGELK